MRIRKLARLLAENKQIDVPPLQHKQDDDDEKRKKVVEETTPADENHLHEAGGKPIGNVVTGELGKKMIDEKNHLHEAVKLPIGNVVSGELGKKMIDEKNHLHREAVKPIGNVVKVSGEGKKMRKYFGSFEYKGIEYNVEDSVMFWSGIENRKPFVAIIKDVIQERNGIMMLNVQWFYRPEDTEKNGGKLGYWESNETRELYYSFHQDETNVESIMHKCVVHFIPLGKQIPSRKQHPGFVVQKVYDPQQKKLFRFTDNVYFKNKRQQIDLLIQKTVSRVGELVDVKRKYDLKEKKT